MVQNSLIVHTHKHTQLFSYIPKWIVKVTYIPVVMVQNPLICCDVALAEEKKEEKAKEEEEIGDLDQLLRIERLKEQKRKDEAETIEPEEDEAQVISV